MMTLTTSITTTITLQDTSGAAYVARPNGPPDTTGYMWAGYAVGTVILGGYLLLLLRRQARERRSLGDARRD